jgi:hypothetical protein
MPSFKELERRVIEQNERTCEECERDNCTDCDMILDVRDLWDTLGDQEHDRQRDEKMYKEV